MVVPVIAANDSKAEGPPVELRSVEGGLRLVVSWSGSRETVLTAVALRQACRCAYCTASHARGEPVVAAPNIAITAIAAIGGYAVNIAFSDGHDRGIFPWSFLRAVALLPMNTEVLRAPVPTGDPIP
jgi:DUF971 family protein